MIRPIRAAVGLATATVLSVAASGCVTVHGELAVVPTAGRGEAAKALDGFQSAYNAADTAFDPSKDKGIVTGALGAINQAGLRSRHVTSPNGNTGHQDLALSDPVFTIPKKAGWPRWFVADAASNLAGKDAKGRENRWLMAFMKDAPDAGWKVAYLTVLPPDAVPSFRTDKDGYGVPVAPDSPDVAVAPGRLSSAYAGYLDSGSPDDFVSGPYTDAWRQNRAKGAHQARLVTQYVDQPLSGGDFTPVALATDDGGAMVFFATRYFQRETAAKGFRPAVSPDIQPLMTGQVKSVLTEQWVSVQVVVDPPRDTHGKVAVLGRLAGVTGATGS